MFEYDGKLCSVSHWCPPGAFPCLGNFVMKIVLIHEYSIKINSIFIHCGVEKMKMKKSHSPAGFGDDHLCSDIMKFRPQISLVQVNFDFLHTLRARIGKKKLITHTYLIYLLYFFCLNMVTNAKNIITLYLNKEWVLGCKCFYYYYVLSSVFSPY